MTNVFKLIYFLLLSLQQETILTTLKVKRAHHTNSHWSCCRSRMTRGITLLSEARGTSADRRDGIQLPKHSHLVLPELPWGSHSKLHWAAGLQGEPELLPYKTAGGAQAGLKCQGWYQKWYLTLVFRQLNLPLLLEYSLFWPAWSAWGLQLTFHSIHTWKLAFFFSRDFSKNKSSSSTQRICFPSYTAGKGLKRLSDSFLLLFFPCFTEMMGCASWLLTPHWPHWQSAGESLL